MTVRAKHQAAYAASMLSLIVFQLIMFFVKGLSDYHSDILFSFVSQCVCMGLIPLAVLLLLKRREGVAETFRCMRYKKPKDSKVCLFATIGLVFLITPFTMVFNALSRMILNIIGYQRGFSNGAIYGGIADFFLYAVTTALLPAVFEEFTHRGVLLSGLENRGSELSAVVLSSVCFGLMHTNPNQMLYATVGGLVFGAAVTKTDSMIPAMCAHFANNFVSLILDYSEQKQTALGAFIQELSEPGVFTFLLSVVALGFSVYGIYKILQYLARQSDKPISEKKLFGIIVMDSYRPDGKATLKDNAFLIATVIMESALLIVLTIWGMVR